MSNHIINSSSIFNTFLMLMLICQCNSTYRQSLTVTEDNMVRIQFNVCQKYLPIPLQTLHQQFNSRVVIQYGPYFHQFSKGLSANTITTRIQFKENSQPWDEDRLFPQQLKQILIGAFAISVSDRYGCYIKQSNSWVFNDPNDKFCIHHIEQIVRNFLPCASHSGLAQLIDVETMFSAGSHGPRLYGMKIIWDAQGMDVGIYVPLDRKIEGINKIKINQKCLSDSELVMADAFQQKISIRQIVVNRLEESAKLINHTQVPRMINARKDMVGNWYNPNKNLQIAVEISNLYEYYLNNSVLVIRELIPARAGVEEITIQNRDQNYTHITFNYYCQQVDNQRQIKYKSPNTLCEIRVRLTYTNQLPDQPFILLINIKLNNKLICFDNYQAIFGGGAQIPNIPITLQQMEEIQYIYSGPASLRTPQPDQSLPFQVMTFVLGIFGYLWLSIWRKLVSQLQARQKMEQIQNQ